jgi:hypothetical protein
MYCILAFSVIFQMPCGPERLGVSAVSLGFVRDLGEGSSKPANQRAICVIPIRLRKCFWAIFVINHDTMIYLESKLMTAPGPTLLGSLFSTRTVPCTTLGRKVP